MISILDYGIGNLASVRNALKYLGLPNQTISSPAQVKASGHLLLPGVGAFAAAMDALVQNGLVDALREHATAKQRPLLGICLGMQLLMDEGREAGRHAGLGLIKGIVEPLPVDAGLVIPHMGWNDVRPTRPSRLREDPAGTHSFYFVHGYFCNASDPMDVTAMTEYGIEFPSMIERDNVFGCQFHPEKSQRHGLSILSQFFKV
ncbi:MAG: imidazole glycerol phosphate synthase, glutamine amidotransferase subunit [Gammaproteobacteria bacterium RIFCSPHIGHO2_12_FULL_63_22]|nr:MAG: imidazole glycerol phosphate synthase, glutamine amidotransferase subunit [Gammaproteobacteria bacterium RIFCSPHIGHO2_12_FULL_63_22]